MPRQIFQRPQPVNRSNYGKPGKAGADAPWGPAPAGAPKGRRLGKGGVPLLPKPARTPDKASEGEPDGG